MTNRLLESDKKSDGENIPVVYIMGTLSSNSTQKENMRLESDRFRKSIDQTRVFGDITNVINIHEVPKLDLSSLKEAQGNFEFKKEAIETCQENTDQIIDDVYP